MAKYKLMQTSRTIAKELEFSKDKDLGEIRMESQSTAAPNADG